jgi:hypothetical protein
METSSYLQLTQWQIQDSRPHAQLTIEIPQGMLEKNPTYLEGYYRYNVPCNQSLIDQVRQFTSSLYEEKKRHIRGNSHVDPLTSLQISQLDQLDAEYRDIRSSLDKVNLTNSVQPLNTSELINKGKISRPSIKQILLEKGLDPAKYRITDSEFDAATGKAYFSSEDWE